MDEFLTTNDAARILNKAPVTVLYYARWGKLSPIRTRGGMRLFSRMDVERLASELEARKLPGKTLAK
jgi:DNA-binding transcriptional MerR regulator